MGAESLEPAPVSLGALGFVVGFLSGMFGVGGGFILTPLLNLVFGIPYPVAVGSGLCQMIGTGTSALLRHRGLRQGEPRVDWLMLAGSVVGVHLGAEVLGWLSGLGSWSLNGRAIPAVKLVLQPAYAVVLVWIAGLLSVEAWKHRSEAGPKRPAGPLARVPIPPYVELKNVGLGRVSVPLLAYLGLALGFFSGLLGIGGGVLLMPALIYGLGFPIHQAAGTGILVLIVTVAAGTIEHALAGNVLLGIALPLLVGSSLGAQFGAFSTRRLRGHQMRLSFALVLLATVAALFIDLARAVSG